MIKLGVAQRRTASPLPPPGGGDRPSRRFSILPPQLLVTSVRCAVVISNILSAISLKNSQGRSVVTFVLQIALTILDTAITQKIPTCPSEYLAREMALTTHVLIYKYEARLLG